MKLNHQIKRSKESKFVISSLSKKAVAIEMLTKEWPYNFLCLLLKYHGKSNS